MGGSKSPPCNQIAEEIWLWETDRNIWLSATHLPGAQNIIADHKSHNFSDNTEWMLDPTVFHTFTGVCTTEYHAIFYHSYFMSQAYIMDYYCFFV